MTATALTQPVARPRPETTSLAIVLRAEDDRRVLAREAVLETDLIEVYAEAWRELLLRRGHTSVPFEVAAFGLAPVMTGSSAGRCTGFAVEVELPDGTRPRIEFGTRALTDVARRATTRLLDQGLVNKDQLCVYEIAVDTEARPMAVVSGEVFEMSVRAAPLTNLSVPVRPLLRQARAVDLEDDRVFPVFYTAAALAQAEQFSRRGGSMNPPVETGGVTTGPLCVCPETGEFFAVVTDVFELTDAEEKQFSLSYSGRTWSRLLAVLRARQQVQPALRMLGQCHGHNFVPGERCSKCEHAVKCDFTSVFTSEDDRRWMCAVFRRQPWALCHIFGLTARNEPVAGLHALHGGAWRERGFFVLPDFDPTAWPATAAS